MPTETDPIPVVSPMTASQSDCLSKLRSKMAQLKGLMFDLKEIRLDFDVSEVLKVTDEQYAVSGAHSDLSPGLVALYPVMIDRLDAATITASQIPAVPQGLPLPIVVFAKLARG